MYIRLRHLPEIVITDTNQKYPVSNQKIFTTSLIIQASEKNNGVVIVGGPELSGENGFRVLPGSYCTIEYTAPNSFGDHNLFSLDEIFLKSTHAGDVVRLIYWGRGNN